GRADDQAIASVARRRLAIDDKIHLDDVKGRTRLQRHLVEAEIGDRRRGSLPFAGEDALEHDMARDMKLATQNAGKDVADLGGGQVGEEAERAEIDAEDRYLTIGHLPGGAEDSAVAPHHESQVCGDLTEVFRLEQIEQ